MDLKNLNPSPVALVGLVLGGVALLFLAMYLRRRSDGPNDRISTPARVCLVLLRMAIGWHFLVEGLEKLHTPDWTSAGYLRESSGPLAPTFRELAGDPVIAQLTLTDTKGLPEALDKEWQRYFDAFVAHYKFDGAQTAAAREKFDKAKKSTLAWMLQKRPVKKLSPFPPDYDVDWTIEDRLSEYNKRFLTRLADVEKSMPERGKDAWKEWRDAKADVAKWRGELVKDLDAQALAFKTSLSDMLKPPVPKKKTTDKKDKAPADAKDAKAPVEEKEDPQKLFYESLSAEQKATRPLVEPLPRPFSWQNRLDVADFAVKWSLVAVGVGLIAGCFTRLAAVVGAVLLLSFFLAMPPLPYLPESPKAEGHYMYINKNIIEMLALLALAALPTGRWAGLDGLLQFLNPFRWRTKEHVVLTSSMDKRLQSVKQ
jgi:uncharacterized membrane protein YphA (DoxX/SURF4 family)